MRLVTAQDASFWARYSPYRRQGWVVRGEGGDGEDDGGRGEGGDGKDDGGR